MADGQDDTVAPPKPTLDEDASGETLAPGEAPSSPSRPGRYMIRPSTPLGPTVDEDASGETLAPGDGHVIRPGTSPTQREGYVIRPSRPLKPTLDDDESPLSRPSGPVRIARYVVERRLAAGGMGVVFLADDPELQRRVVIKLLRSDRGEGSQSDRARMLREAQAMAKVSHANVVPVFDVGVHDEQVFLAMEYLDGGDLSAWLKAPRTPRGKLDVFMAAGRGLAAAHRAGLVHRDFKPQNVMLGSDGSVKVTDFGLARAEPPPPPGTKMARLSLARPRIVADDTSPGSLLDTPLTQAGAVVGTPAYMAPEQILAEPVDGRADQFSFCVALYEALYGERPFAGKTVDEVFDSTLAGAARTPARTRDVPDHVRDAIRRGLSVQPAERFPSMDALLAAVAPRSRRRAILVASIAGVALLSAGGAALVLGGGSDDSKLCTGGAAELAAVWSPVRKAELERAFLATNAKVARPAFALLATAIDRYAEDWQVTYRDACEATRVRRDHTETVMENRMRCLRRRRAELDALIAIAGKPDADLMADTTSLVGRLDAPGTCANVESLDKEIADPKRRADVEQLETEVAKAKALQAANRVDASSAQILDVRKRADKLGHPPLLAELELQLGLNAYQKLDLEVAEKHLHRAVEIAEQVGADRIRARAFLDLISIAATRTRLDEAERWQRYAQSTIIRLGNDRELAAQLELRVAAVLQQRGNAKLAESTFKSAIDKLAAIHGGSSRQVALARRQLAGFYHATNNYDRAFDEHRAVRDLMQKLYGPDHAETAESIGLMAAARHEQKRFEEAIALEEDGQRRLVQHFGDDHPIVAQGYAAYAMRLQGIGRNDAALATMNRAVAVMAKYHGENHMLYASTLGQLALLYMNLGSARWDDAFATWQRSLDIYIAASANEEVVITLNAMGTMRRRQGKLDEALAIYERTRAAIAKFEQPNGRLMTDTLTRIGMVEIARKRHADAIAVLEQALAARTAGGAVPALVSWTRFELAQAVWELGRDRKRAVALAREAEAEAKQDNDTAQIELIDKWLATHR